MYKDFIEDRINVFLEEFEKLIIKENIPITDFLYKECDYKLDNTLPEIDDSFTLFTRIFFGILTKFVICDHWKFVVAFG